MRVEILPSGELMIVFSRRNLEAMLAKLNGHPPNSNCTINGGTEAAGIVFKGEENDVHYAHRPAGEIHPDTLLAIADLPTQ